MNLLDAIWLGLVEGITEYLPVSSTGHLLIAQRLLGISTNDASNAYAITIQVGAILAVFLLYRRRILSMVMGLLGRNQKGRTLLLALLCAFLPAALVGYFLDDTIERTLFGPWPIVAAWAVGGVVLLFVGSRLRDRPGRSLTELHLWPAFLIGLAQCLALWPGVSRSLATLLGGVAVGLSLPAALEFSFLLGLLTLGAATGYRMLGSGATLLTSYGLLPCLVGILTALVSAILAVRWLVSFLQRRSLALFGWWRLGAAAIVAGLLLSGRL